MQRVAVLAFGVFSYLVFLGTFLYAVGFVGNLVVPKSIDSSPNPGIRQALLVNLALLALFAVQHSVMARPGFKRFWTRLVPQPVERSTYVLVSSAVLALLFWQWRSMPGVVWESTGPVAARVLQAVFWAGWAIVLLSTFMTDHLDLFGLRQVFLFATGRPYTPLGFKTTALYRYVRHPIMLGFVIAFWAAPTMTLGHLVFAVATTLYILVALQLEERDLLSYHGDAYAQYRRRVGMLVPRLLKRRRSAVNCDQQ